MTRARGAPAISVRRLLPVVVSIAMAAACTSSGSGEPATAEATVKKGSLPPGTGWLEGSGTFGGAAQSQALHASNRVLLGVPHPYDAEGAGPPVVLRSTDDGRSWRPVDLPGPGGGGPRTLWAGGGRAAVLALEAIRPLGRGTGIVRISDDAGATWRAVTVPDPNGTGRWIGHGIWWKDRWIFYGAAERPGGSGWPSYSAIWQSTDGRHLDFTPGLLPGGPEHLTADRLTVIDDTLLAVGRNSGGVTRVWRSSDGIDWTLLDPGVSAIGAGALVRGDEVSLDGGRTWRQAEEGLLDAGRTGSTWWFVQHEETDIVIEQLQRLLRTDDGGRTYRPVNLPPRPRLCRAGPIGEQTIHPPREVGSALVIVSTCTATDSETWTGPTEVQILMSRDDGISWSEVDTPKRPHGKPIAMTVRDDRLTVVLQDEPVRSERGRTTVVTVAP